MGISVSTSKQSVTATVNDQTVNASVAGGGASVATVAGGFGATGAAGAAATVTVGTVTTGAPGSSASVVNAGSSSAAVLDFTIPAGAAGANGAAGATGPAGSSGVISVSAPLTNSGSSSSASIALSVGAGLAVSSGTLIVSGLGISDISGLQAALDGKQASGSYAAASHSHAASEVTSGTFDPARLPIATANAIGAVQIGSGISIDGNGVISASSGYTLPNATTSTLGGVIVGTGLGVSSGTVSVTYGTSSGTACQGNDARLSDSRTPTSHASSHQIGGSDAIANVVNSPSQISSTQNDYSLPSADVVRLTSDAARTITGFVAGTTGRVVVLVNVGSFAITLSHQSTSSTAANRVIVPWSADYILDPAYAAVLVYDGTTSRWRIV